MFISPVSFRGSCTVIAGDFKYHKFMEVAQATKDILAKLPEIEGYKVEGHKKEKSYKKERTPAAVHVNAKIRNRHSVVDLDPTSPDIEFKKTEGQLTVRVEYPDQYKSNDDAGKVTELTKKVHSLFKDNPVLRNAEFTPSNDAPESATSDWK